MSKTEMATYTCPQCGWTITTPFGAEDNADQTYLHIEKHHPKKTATDHLVRRIR
jgi:hypothetical protein